MPPEPSGPPRRIGVPNTGHGRPTIWEWSMSDTDGGGPRPTAAVLLAAGEGTRMRSALPKVMHRSVASAARARHGGPRARPEHLAVVVGHGREQVRRGRALGEHLGRPLVMAVQDSSPAPAAPSMRPRGAAGRPGGRRGRHVRRRAAAGRRDARGTARRHRVSGRPSRVLTASSTTRPATAGCPRRRRRGRSASSSRRTPTSEQRAIREVNSGVYAFDAAFLRAPSPSCRHRQRPGRALPHRRRARSRAAGGLGARARVPPTCWQPRA